MNILLELIRIRKEYIMYITRPHQPRKIQLKLDNYLDSLFEDTEYTEEEIKNHSIYKDMSYLRTRTIQLKHLDLRVQREAQARLSIFYRSLIDIYYSYDYLDIANNYHTFRIPKATGGFREINAPVGRLKAAQENVAIKMKHLGVLHHDAAYAYIEGRDCKKAIKRHQDNNSNWFLKLDIKKFFNNCNPVFIHEQLRKIYPFALMTGSEYNSLAEKLIAISTLNNELPQGTSISPMLTNWLMIPIDAEITKALYKITGHHFIYTRYADDLLISSSTKFDPAVVIEAINKVLNDTPFELKTEKTRFGSKAGRNWNLGIMYNKDNNLTVGYKRKKRLKTMLHQLLNLYKDKMPIDPTFARSVQGELAYLKNIEPEYHQHLTDYIRKHYNVDAHTIIKYILKNL